MIHGLIQIDPVNWGNVINAILSKRIPKILIFFGVVLIVRGAWKTIPRLGSVDRPGRIVFLLVGILLVLLGAIGYPLMFNGGGTETPTDNMKVDEIAFSFNFTDQRGTMGLTPVIGEIELPPVECPYRFEIEIRMSVTGGRGDVTYQFMENNNIVSEERIEFDDSTSRIIKREPVVNQSGRYVYRVRIRSPDDNEVSIAETSPVEVRCSDS